MVCMSVLLTFVIWIVCICNARNAMIVLNYWLIVIPDIKDRYMYQ